MDHSDLTSSQAPLTIMKKSDLGYLFKLCKSRDKSSDNENVLDPNDDTYEKEYLAPKEKKPKLEEKVKKEETEETEKPTSNIGKSETATGNLKIGGATKAKGGYR